MGVWRGCAALGASCEEKGGGGARPASPGGPGARLGSPGKSASALGSWALLNLFRINPYGAVAWLYLYLYNFGCNSYYA